MSDRAVGAALRRTFNFRSLLNTAIFDIAGPLVTYRVLHSLGASDIVALLSSGVPPAIGVAVAAKAHHRLDVIGALVLLGVAIGTALGLLTDDPQLVLLEGAIPTLLFSLACFLSLLVNRPLMFLLLRALAGTRGITAGELRGLADDPGTQQDFRVLTKGWGVGFFVESVLKAVVVLNSSTGLALTVSKVAVYPMAIILLIWSVWYRRRARRRRRRDFVGPVGARPRRPGPITRRRRRRR